MSRTRREAAQHKRAARKPPDGHYTAIHNSVLTDPSLSLAAFRVLMYLATKPDGWTVQTADIMNSLDLSRHAVREVARPELVEAGYLKTEDIRDSTGKLIRRETTVIRPLVVYLGKSAGQNLRREIPDAGNAPDWVDTLEDLANGDVSADQNFSRGFPDAGSWPAPEDATDKAVSEDVFAGGNLRREIPDAGKTRLLVTTDKVVTTEVVTNVGWCIGCQAMVPGSLAPNGAWRCNDHRPAWLSQAAPG